MGNQQSLLDQPISSLVPKDFKLVSVSSGSSVEEGLALLKQHGLSSLPVDNTPNDSFSYSDAARFLVLVNFDKDRFLNAKVSETDVPHKDVVVQPSATIISVMERILKYRPYRVLVGEDGQAVTGIVSQLDLIRFAYDHREVLVPDRALKLLQLSKIGSAKQLTISEKTTLADATRQLFEKKQYAVAVVNDLGVMKGALTPQSFRSLAKDHFPNFAVETVGGHEVEGRDQGWITAETTLEEVLKRIVENGLHRLWVIDDNQKPVKVITLSDLINYLVEAHHTEEQKAAAKKERKEHKKDKKEKKEKKGEKK